MTDELGGEAQEPAGRPGHRVAELRRRELTRLRREERRARFLRALPWMLAVGLAGVAVVSAALLIADMSRKPIIPSAAGSRGPGLVVERTFRSLEATETQPTGVAVSGDRVYVADPLRGLVDVFTRDGSHVATIGAGYLDVPVYVAVGPVDGRVYVSDRGLGTVAVFAADGTRFGVLDPQGLSSVETTPVAWRPLGLAFATNGTLYVADSSADAHIAVFSPAGSRVATLGSDVPAGRIGRPLSFPNGIVVTRDEVLVADSNNGRIIHFGLDGAYRRAVVLAGMPRGIAALPDGGLLISDAASGELSTYGADGKVRATLAHTGALGTGLAAPSGVAVGRDGRLYVADSASGIVAVMTESSSPRAESPVTADPRWWLLALALLGGTAATASVTFGSFRARAHTHAGERGYNRRQVRVGRREG